MSEEINVTADLQRLAEIEAEREAILARLKIVHETTGEVLGAAGPTTTKPVKKAPPPLDEATLGAGLAAVKAGDAKSVDRKVLEALKKAGLVKAEGKGRAARWVAVEGAP